MPSTKPQVKAIVEPIEYEKFKYIAEKENRSVSNLIQTMVKDKIQTYEVEHGPIQIESEE